MLYVLFFYTATYFFNTIVFDTLSTVVTIFLLLIPLFLKNISVIFNHSSTYFDEVIQNNAKRLLIDYNTENKGVYLIKTKTDNMSIHVYLLNTRTAILLYKGNTTGKKILIYKNLLKKSFHGVLPTITINLIKK